MALRSEQNLDLQYNDLDLDFDFNTTTKDVMKKTGAEAVKRSIRNLVMTNFYERPFRSNVGSNVRGVLFENADPITGILLQDAITDVINKFEPRVTLNQVIVDMDIDNNGFNVRIEYTINKGNIPIISTLFLERIR